jgi:carbonic anhydrase
MANFDHLLDGYRLFKATTFNECKDSVGHLIRLGLKPKTLVISGSDLRISPDTIFNSNVGELFIYRNMGGLVPKYDHKGASGIVAGIEYAVMALKVETIVVLGHIKSDSMKMIMDCPDLSEDAQKVKESEEMQAWLGIADEAKQAVLSQLANKTQSEKEHACEKECIVLSLKNLLTYPFIKERAEQNKIELFGWHFNIQTGELLAFNPENGYFDPIG